MLTIERVENTVTISLDEYEMLIRDSQTMRLLESVIYQNAELSWDKKKLSIDSDSIGLLLRAINPDKHDMTLELLKAEREAKDE